MCAEVAEVVVEVSEVVVKVAEVMVEVAEVVVEVVPKVAELCLLKVLEVLETLAGLEVLGGDALCAALYTGGRGG